MWIPRGATHRVSNPHDVPGRFLEIALGDFDEDDIERLEDDYARAARLRPGVGSGPRSGLRLPRLRGVA